MKTFLRFFTTLTAVVLLAACASCEIPITRSTGSSDVKDTLEVFFLDVKQADCILVKTGNHAMLVDAANRGQDNLVLGYLEQYGVTSLDYLVATHPDADHIGSMASVIRKMDSIGEIIMPDKTHTTVTFSNLMDAIEEKDLPMRIATPGYVFQLGEATIQIIAPNGSSYSDMNDWSVVLRIEFGTTTFLLAGDAETKSEGEQLANNLPLQADVIKIGHHGSSTSSTQSYLNAVSPSYAVISCGTGNTYRHPHVETLERLEAMGVEIYRTDLNGTIIFTTDGNEIQISVEID